LSALVRWARSHAKDYVTSLDDQSEQFFDHIQDTQVVIKPFIDLEDFESREYYDSNARNGNCFANFA
jgi:hypothetical protein